MPKPARNISRFHAKTLLTAIWAYAEFMQCPQEQAILDIAKIHEAQEHNAYLDQAYTRVSYYKFSFMPYDDYNLRLDLEVCYRKVREEYVLYKLYFTAAGSTSHIAEFRYDSVGERIPRHHQDNWGDGSTDYVRLKAYQESLKAARDKL